MLFNVSLECPEWPLKGHKKKKDREKLYTALIYLPVLAYFSKFNNRLHISLYIYRLKFLFVKLQQFNKASM